MNLEKIPATVITGFLGAASQQIRIIGEAAQTQAIPFRRGMTVLDVIIAVGGLTEFAAGNRAVIVRTAKAANIAAGLSR